jgi:hypothetical protein
MVSYSVGEFEQELLDLELVVVSGQDAEPECVLSVVGQHSLLELSIRPQQLHLFVVLQLRHSLETAQMRRFLPFALHRHHLLQSE